SALPMSGARFSFVFEVVGRPPLPPARQPSMETRVASAGYFKTMGIAVRRGRGVTAADDEGAAPVGDLSEAAARGDFPKEEPLGRYIKGGLRREDGLPSPGGEVVGVVADVKEFGLRGATPPEIYLSSAQVPFESMDVVMKTSVPPASLRR